MDDGIARDAPYLTEGHEYIFAITVDQIRIDTYDDITFTVKPYIVDSDGKKLYSSVYTVTYNDGILVG